MTIETYDDLKRYVGSKDDFTDDLLNMGYTKGRADEREKIIAIIHSFFRDELDKLETVCDGSDEYYKDTLKVDMILHMNKEICTRIKEQKKCTNR